MLVSTTYQIVLQQVVLHFHELERALRDKLKKSGWYISSWVNPDSKFLVWVENTKNTRPYISRNVTRSIESWIELKATFFKLHTAFM